jgi:UDP-galactopyranose mutase
MSRVLIVGAGLTGCTLAHRLALEGIRSTLLERAPVAGGLIRSGHMEGVLHEPHGSHIFHTEDAEVWELANSMTPFNDYRHRVDIVVEGRILNWPILLSDIDLQTRSEEIHEQLREREGLDAAARAQAADFEQWCLDLMGPILYERYIRPYTEKQWGRPARELSARWAPRRVSVRWDNDPYLFADPFQGWPAGPNGYTDLIDGLLASKLISVRHGVDAGEHRRTRPRRRRRRGGADLSAGRLLRTSLRRARVAWDPGVVGTRATCRVRPGGDGRQLPRSRVPLHPHP